MSRELITEEIAQIKNNNILLELATGTGKSKQALEIIKARNPHSILIVVPKLVLIDTWSYEFKKWGCKKYEKLTVFSTYAGLHLYENQSYDMIIFDECHHLTERCLAIVKTFKFKYSILLSATVGRFYFTLREYFPDLYRYKITAKEAIDNDILPDPKVYLLPLSLSKSGRNYKMVLRQLKASGKTIGCYYPERWKYLKDKAYTQIIALCTQFEYIQELNNQISYWKNKTMRNQIFKNKWLRLAGERLKTLSEYKQPIILQLLEKLKDERTLIFCNSIEQTEKLCTNSIHSKNDKCLETLEDFNNGSINHISACDMLNEGVNLVNCKVGIYAALNSSEILIKQKLGRLLRHPNPVLIIPYYINTREEEIVTKMLEDYNPELVFKVKSIDEIKL